MLPSGSTGEEALQAPRGPPELVGAGAPTLLCLVLAGLEA